MIWLAASIISLWQFGLRQYDSVICVHISQCDCTDSGIHHAESNVENKEKIKKADMFNCCRIKKKF